MGRVGADGLLPRFIWAAPLVGVVGETARGRRHDGTSGRRAAAAAAILDGAAAGDLSLSLPVVRSRLPTPFCLCSSTFCGGGITSRRIDLLISLSPQKLKIPVEISALGGTQIFGDATFPAFICTRSSLPVLLLDYGCCTSKVDQFRAALGCGRTATISRNVCRIDIVSIFVVGCWYCTTAQYIIQSCEVRCSFQPDGCNLDLTRGTQ